MTNTFSLPGAGSKYKKANATPAGFLAGLWHGILLPITLILSLFNENISISETNNNGIWYKIGVLAGLSLLLGNQIHISIGQTEM